MKLQELLEQDLSDAQKEAGNYKKKHITFHGLNIAIENKKGSVRSGTSENGDDWSVTMPADYGYIKKTIGSDGDHVDVYVGPKKNKNCAIFIIDQVHTHNKKFDEHKIMIGFDSKKDAEKTYDKAFDDGKGPQRRKHISTVSLDELKDWLNNKNTKKPFHKDLKESREKRYNHYWDDNLEEEYQDWVNDLPKPLKEGYTIGDEEVEGAHSGQVDAVIFAKNIKGTVIGYVQYLIRRGIVYFKIIKVDKNSGFGVGIALIEKLAEIYGFDNIEPGMMSDEGMKFYNAYKKYHERRRPLREEYGDVVDLVSTALSWIKYDPDIEKLHVEFTSGSEYSYDDVPQEVIDQLLKARSHGRFFYYYIRMEYNYQRLT